MTPKYMQLWVMWAYFYSNGIYFKISEIFMLCVFCFTESSFCSFPRLARLCPVQRSSSWHSRILDKTLWASQVNQTTRNESRKACQCTYGAVGVRVAWLDWAELQLVPKSCSTRMLFQLTRHLKNRCANMLFIYLYTHSLFLYNSPFLYTHILYLLNVRTYQFIKALSVASVVYKETPPAMSQQTCISVILSRFFWSPKHAEPR